MGLLRRAELSPANPEAVLKASIAPAEIGTLAPGVHVVGKLAGSTFAPTAPDGVLRTPLPPGMANPDEDEAGGAVDAAGVAPPIFVYRRYAPAPTAAIISSWSGFMRTPLGEACGVSLQGR